VILPPGTAGSLTQSLSDRLGVDLSSIAEHVPGAEQVSNWLEDSPEPAGPGSVDGPGTPPRTIGDPAIAELSGLAASRLHPGVLYGVNDSRNTAEVFAIAADGTTAARLTVLGAVNTDWEALAPGWDAGGAPVLWIGDIGDNGRLRDGIRLLRIAEPTALADAVVPSEVFDLVYPDGPHNAETLLVDPRDGTVLIVTKADGAEGRIYRAPQLRSDRINVLELVGTAPPMITDGAFELGAAGAPRLVLIDYWRIHRQQADGSWAAKLGTLQLGTEAVAWPWPAGDDGQILIGSEGTGSRIVAATAP
jgi:hypothetical protein